MIILTWILKNPSDSYVNSVGPKQLTFALCNAIVLCCSSNGSLYLINSVLYAPDDVIWPIHDNNYSHNIFNLLI